MENNLYYTPEISEFHVGFEYEEYQFLERNWKIVKCEFIKPDTIIDPKWFRVKTLDQSDIESLGWMLSHQYNGAWWEIGKLIPDAEEMWHPLGNWKYRLSLGENNRVHIDGRNPGNGGQTSRFNGTIKNKSQLKFIMTCLGILE